MMFTRIFDRIVLLLLVFSPIVVIVVVGAEAELWAINDVTYLTRDNLNLNSSNYRQSFCDEYKVMIDNNLNVKDALAGATLNVLISVEEGDGYFNYNKDHNATGIYAEIMEHIAKEAKFTMNVSVAEYALDMNNTFTEKLIWSTEHYDISVEDWERSSDRINLGINFMDSFYDSSYIIVRSVVDENNKKKVVWTNWLAPFTHSVWFVLLATIIYSSFVNQFLEYLRIKANGKSEDVSRKWSSTAKRTVDNMYLSFLNFTQQFSYEPSSLAGKIFSISFVFWSMLIGAAYTANLASLLVERSVGGLAINTIQDCIDNQMRVCVHASSNMDEYFTQEYPTLVMVRGHTRNELYDLLNANECDVLIGAKQHYETVVMKEEYNPDCKLQWNGRKIKEVGSSFATKIDPGQKCTSLISEVFNYYLNEMISSGYLEDLWNAHELREATRDSSCFASIDNNNNNNRRRKLKDNAHTSHRSLSSISASGSNEDNSDDIDAEALNLRQMAGTFLVHVVGSTIAIIVGLISFWNKPRRRNNKKTRQSQLESARQSQFESSQSTSSCNAAVDNNINNNNNKNTYTINQEHPYSVEGNNGCSTSSQLQQFEELTKRMDDFQSQMHTMLSLMASTKTKET